MDAAIDVGVDAASLDAPIEERDSGPPPPPWEPAFPARRVFHDPAVTCAPIGEYEYSPPIRSSTPGDLEWSIDPVRAPGWAGILAEAMTA